MIYYGLAERMALEFKYARREISDHEYLLGMIEITRKMRQQLLFMETVVGIVALVVCGGLALLAIRLATFS